MNCNVIYNLTLKKINVVRLRWQYSFITYKNGHILVIEIYSISLSLHFFLIYVIKSLSSALPHARDWNHLINASPKKKIQFSIQIFIFSPLYSKQLFHVCILLFYHHMRWNKINARPLTFSSIIGTFLLLISLTLMVFIYLFSFYFVGCWKTKTVQPSSRTYL